MKHLFSSALTLLAAIFCAFSLGSCSRANYAVLPKAAPYLGSVTNQRPAVAQQPTQQTVAATPAAAPSVVAAPTASVPAQAASAAQTPAARTTDATPQARPTLAQRLLVQKVLKKTDKLVTKAQSRTRNGNTVETSRLNSNLKLGIILAVLGALLTLLGSIFNVIGLVLVIIGVLFIVIAILDMV